MDKWDACAFPVNEEELIGRTCYGGLDLSSTSDITAFVLVFPPRNAEEKYIILPYCWVPEDNMRLRVRRDHIPYDVWAAERGLVVATVMALDRAIRNQGSEGSVYDEGEFLFFKK